MPTIDAPDGYSFEGWYTDEALTIPFVSSRQITADMTLHAKWHKTGYVGYTVYYQDELGATLHDPYVVSDVQNADKLVASGTAVSVAPITIEGYYALSGSKSISTTDDAAANTVVFTYRPAATWSYTINCVDETTGAILKTITTKTYAVQEVIWPFGISGYALDTSKTPYGPTTLTPTNATMTYYYTPDAPYRVTYDWGTTTPEGVALPTNAGTYIKGSMCEPDTMYVADYEVAATQGAEGVWVFSGWNPSEGFAIAGDTTIRGSWTLLGRVTVTGGSSSLVYDGREHGISTYSVEGLRDGDTLTGITYRATGTDAGTLEGSFAGTPMILNGGGNDVTSLYPEGITLDAGSLTITPAQLTVITPSVSKLYDGTALTAEGTISGFVNGETATLSTTGSQTMVGSTVNTYSLVWDGTAKASNYTISEQLGALAINAPSQAAGNMPAMGDTTAHTLVAVLGILGLCAVACGLHRSRRRSDDYDG